MLAEVAKGEPVAGLRQQRAGRLRDEHLSAMADRGDPSATMESEANVAAVLAPYEPGDGTEPPAALVLAAAWISSTLTPACSQSVARSK
jgi:hypothetical protein